MKRPDVFPRSVSSNQAYAAWHGSEDTNLTDFRDPNVAASIDSDGFVFVKVNQGGDEPDCGSCVAKSRMQGDHGCPGIKDSTAMFRLRAYAAYQIDQKYARRGPEDEEPTIHTLLAETSDLGITMLTQILCANN